MFNGECTIGLSYEQKGEIWEVEAPLDGRIAEMVRKEGYFHDLYSVLPGIRTEQRPYAHYKMLMAALGKANLDGGSVSIKQGGSYAEGNQTYKVVITVKERLRRFRAG